MFGEVFQKNNIENIFNAFGICSRFVRLVTATVALLSTSKVPTASPRGIIINNMVAVIFATSVNTAWSKTGIIKTIVPNRI